MVEHKCGENGINEEPHPIHGAKISCAECGKFIKWLGIQQSPNEYFQKMTRLAKEKGFKPGFAAVKFKEKFGRWPEAQDKC